MHSVKRWIENPQSLDDLAHKLEIPHKISGYSLHTGPMVIATVLCYLNEPANGLEALLRCGGDTDTTCAIAGGLLGTYHGPECWPDSWKASIHNGPPSLTVLSKQPSI